MREKLRTLWNWISPASLWDADDEDDWEDFDTRDDYISGAEGGRAGGKAPVIFRPALVWGLVFGLAAAAILVYQISSRRHSYTSYRVTASYPAEDISGTSYARLGNDFLKYGSDGVALVDASGSTIWSSAYTMQTTAFDQNGEAALLYEQQGSQVVSLNKSGVLGQFQTDLPILKGSVAANGVSALLLKKDADTLIRLYSPDGTTLAEVKPTLDQTGQPLALDLSRDAVRLMVSMAKVGQGTVDSTLSFYDFSSTTESAQKHMTGSVSYQNELFGEVFFADDRTPVAVAEDCFVVLSGPKDPTEKVKIALDGEIASLAYDRDRLALVRLSDDPNNRYQLTIYNFRGKQLADTLFNQGYEELAFDSGELLLWSQGHLSAYTEAGILRLDSDFEGRVELFVKIPGFRRYCVLSDSGMTRIEAE